MNTFSVIIRNIIFILHFFQVRRTFSTPSWRDHHDTWKEQRYNWLPSWKEIPKHLHDPLDSAHLQKLSVSNICFRGRCCDTFYCFYQMVSDGQKRTELLDFCYINSKFPNYHTVVWIRGLTQLGSGWYYSLLFLVYFKFAKTTKTPLVGLRAYQYLSRGGTHWRQNNLRAGYCEDQRSFKRLGLATYAFSF